MTMTEGIKSRWLAFKVTGITTLILLVPLLEEALARPGRYG
jgi:hypothetical protein